MNDNVRELHIPKPKEPLRFAACETVVGSGVWKVIDDAGMTVAELFAPAYGEGAADLLAAAPFLREALTGLMETFAAKRDGQSVSVNQVRAAIKKAALALEAAGEWEP